MREGPDILGLRSWLHACALVNGRLTQRVNKQMIRLARSRWKNRIGY
jgi:hypothetical protein